MAFDRAIFVTSSIDVETKVEVHLIGTVAYSVALATAVEVPCVGPFVPKYIVMGMDFAAA